MINARIAKGSRFRITTMVVDEGDFLEFIVPKEGINRATQRNVSVYVSGTWRSVFGDGTEELNEKPMLGLDRRQIIPPPTIRTECVVGPGIYYCVEPIREEDKWQRESLSDLNANFVLAAGDILFAGTGKINEYDAPVFLAPTEDMNISKSDDAIGIVGRIL